MRETIKISQRREHLIVIVREISRDELEVEYFKNELLRAKYPCESKFICIDIHEKISKQHESSDHYHGYRAIVTNPAAVIDSVTFVSYQDIDI